MTTVPDAVAHDEGGRLLLERGRALTIYGQVILGHPSGGEALLEARADHAPVKRSQPFHRSDGAGHVIHEEAGPAVFDHLGHRAAPIRDHRRAAGHRFDHHQPERLGPVDRKQERAGLTQECALVRFADLAHELDQRVAQQGPDDLVEISLIDAIDLGRDLERHAGAAGDLDRVVGPLFRADPPEERQIPALGARREREQARR